MFGFGGGKPKTKQITREIRAAEKAAKHSAELAEYEKACKAYDSAKNAGARAEAKLRALQIERDLGRAGVKFEKHAPLHRK